MNSIQLFEKYAPSLLDKIYKQESTTSEFDMGDKLVKAGKGTNEIVVPVLDMDGLGDYSRNSGYVEGDIYLTKETKRMNYERGRKLMADEMDDEESQGVVLGNVSAEFLRTKVIPEVDAVRYATYAAIPEISEVTEEYSSGEGVYNAIARLWDKMTNDEVPQSDRHLRITSNALGAVRDMDTYKSKELLKKFASIKEVPQERFQTQIELLSGKDSDNERRGGYRKVADSYKLTKDTIIDNTKTYYTKGENEEYTIVANPDVSAIATYYELVKGSRDINFMIIHKPALMQYTKHKKMKVFTPNQDQDGDRYKWLYRLYGLNDYRVNKVAGIAISHK